MKKGPVAGTLQLNSVRLRLVRGGACLGLLLGLGLDLCTFIAAAEALDATTGIDELLAPREERMALIAQLDVHVAHRRRTGRERVA